MRVNRRDPLYNVVRRHSMTHKIDYITLSILLVARSGNWGSASARIKYPVPGTPLQRPVIKIALLCELYPYSFSTLRPGDAESADTVPLNIPSTATAQSKYR